MQTKSVDVSILLVNFNTRKLTEDCINSIVTFTKGVRFEIIVVDNNSTDDSVEFLSRLHKKGVIKLIKNKSNVGFAAANNQGIEIARGSSVLLLNTDTKLTSDAISSTFHTLMSNPSVGIVSCGLKNEDGSLQPSGGYFPTISRLVTWMFFIDDLPLFRAFITSFHPHSAYFRTAHMQDWVTGAFFMIKRQVIDSIGGLDPEYFMYVEEMDFCFRAKQKGFDVYFDPTDSIIHYGQGSGANTNALFMELKNIVLFYKKHHYQSRSVARIILKLGSFARMIIFAILGKGSLSKTYAKALNQI
ncbi:glycosyltransferase family 2 protein [Candidatus Woesebacteria bacterium]|nr:glycosyltransferase family 2 protein [Candidatus Woesebacteria bacterium]